MPRATTAGVTEMPLPSCLPTGTGCALASLSPCAGTTSTSVPAKLHVRRSKGGTASVHPIGGRELRALRRLQREGQSGRYVFVSERRAPLSVAGYQRMVARAGEAAGLPFQISSHVLRHSCGFKLANDGRDTRSIQHYLGHRSIASTVRYTALAPDRFKDFWKRLSGDTEPPLTVGGGRIKRVPYSRPPCRSPKKTSGPHP